jgi:hypothetical protein
VVNRVLCDCEIVPELHVHPAPLTTDANQARYSRSLELEHYRNDVELATPDEVRAWKEWPA